MPTVYRVRRPEHVEAMRFHDLDDYLGIVAWMKARGDTAALANEVRYSTPLMLIPGPTGLMSALPGDWVARDMETGRFDVIGPDLFVLMYEEVGDIDESPGPITFVGEFLT